MSSGRPVDRRGAILAAFDQLEQIAQAVPGPPVGVDLPIATVRHFVAWEPAGVFAFVAGGRQICAVHNCTDAYQLANLAPDERACEGCGFIAAGDYPMHDIGDCPTLAGLERMLRLINA